MSQVFQDDQWKYAKEPAKVPPYLTRAEMQEAIDLQYGEGKIEIEDWRAITDSLSEPRKTR